MTLLLSDRPGDLESRLWEERARLVRLCAHMTGDTDAAEDLAQETLLEAWRNIHTLRDHERFASWLSGIARNVCWRWLRNRGRDQARCIPPSPDRDALSTEHAQTAADAYDLEIELERSELATLLDRALGLVPSATRAVLVERYIEESPHAEIAARLGLSEGAVKVKLHRGKLALRRILIDDFPDEAAAYGLLDLDTTLEHETRIWCSICGQHRLHGRFDRRTGELSFSCPNCAPVPAGISYGKLPDILCGVKGYRAALTRHMAWADEYCRQALAKRWAPCLQCGHPAQLRVCLPHEAPPPPKSGRGIWIDCQVCGAAFWTSLSGVALNLPAGRQFWRGHPRIRLLPERQADVAGTPAIVTSFQSVTDGATYEVIVARDTFEVITVAGRQ